MEYKEYIEKFFNQGHKHYLSHISIDCVVFGFHENELKVLLLNMKNLNSWVLPGGFILKDEEMETAVKRILTERTGLTDIFLHQFQTFGGLSRSSFTVPELFFKNLQIKKDSWMFDRFISVGYYALVEYSKVKPIPDILSEKCEWFNVHDLPELAHDHRHIFDEAWQSLRFWINHYPIGYNLLPEKFTMPDLQKLYETILDRKLDRRNFQRKMLATGILNRLNEVKPGVAHKAPYLYTFNIAAYEKTLKTGFGFAL
ncbi:NUDIX domain-containing protein [Muricauda sp. 334s03]|uniref:NUDIX domain-containing protein n=2 Tax=Flagellimonas TaxID=444459 RepID=A0ABT5XNT3_9FLAO|nr:MULTISPECIES: NUDIX domain-containing protein [Allomuricauda]MDF0707457.1 NUDIX domain-containing protein [[Muricauda] okinawensis]MDF0715358.1 NUDIX domain-containing protein [[Muricauda] yonaguniensis]